MVEYTSRTRHYMAAIQRCQSILAAALFHLTNGHKNAAHWAERRLFASLISH
jgi:hypothetical protein